MQEADEPSVRLSSEPCDEAAPILTPGGGWLIGLVDGVRLDGFHRIVTGGVDRTGWLLAGGGEWLSAFPSTAIFRFMYFSKMASRLALSSVFRRSLSSSLLLQQKKNSSSSCIVLHLACYCVLSSELRSTVQKHKHQIALKFNLRINDQNQNTNP